MITLFVNYIYIYNKVQGLNTYFEVLNAKNTIKTNKI